MTCNSTLFLGEEHARHTHSHGIASVLKLTALLLVLAVKPLSAAASIDGFYDFETGGLDAFRCHGNCPEVTDKIPARSGKYAMRSYLGEGRSNKRRTEAIFSNRKERLMEWERDYWIGFSIYLPNNWKHYGKFEILAQIHASVDEGERQRSPPFAIYTGSGNWKITNRALGGIKNDWVLNSVYEDINRWTDFVIHYKPSYNSSGVLRVWKNGELVASREGPNAYKDTDGPYFTLGLYTGLYDQTEGNPPKTVYHDALRIASGPDAGYEDVAPSGDGPDPGDVPVSFFMDCLGNCPVFSEDVSRWGGAAMRSTVSEASDNSKRTQAIFKGRQSRLMVFEQSYWIGFSIFLPESWVVPGKREVLLEILRTPDPGENHYAALEILTGTGDWTLRSNWGGNQKEWILNSIYESMGRWTDFVIHYKPSFKPSGIIEVWKDGTLVARRNGRNIEKDEEGPFLAIGLLKDYPTPASKSVYHDALRIASGPDARYEDVAPELAR